MRVLDLVRQITRLEAVVAIIIGIVALIYLRFILLPHCTLSADGAYYDCNPSELRSAERIGLQIFLVFIVPVEAFVLPSAIALVRSVRRSGRLLSPLGNFALSWPALSLPLLHPIYYLCVLPIGIALTLLAIVSPRRKLPADFLPFAWNVAWYAVVFSFSVALWASASD